MGAPVQIPGRTPTVAMQPPKGPRQSWDVLSRLEREQPGIAAALTDKRRRWILQIVEDVQRYVEAEGLDFVPVFGGISLIHDNFRVLGKESQAAVEKGADWVDAILPNHRLGFGLDTVLTGTPSHPGAVAGLLPQAGTAFPGAVLKLDLARAEELLFNLLLREAAFSSDLRDPTPNDSVDRTAEYVPVLKEVRLEDGTRLKALTFVLNPDSLKILFANGSTPPRERVATLTYLMQGVGALRAKGDPSGQIHSGRSFDYWLDSYIRPRLARGEQPISEVLEASTRAQVIPTGVELETLFADNSPESRRLQNVVRTMLDGAQTFDELIRLQLPPDANPFELLPAEFRNPGALDRLADAADFLQRRGIVNEAGHLSPEYPPERIDWLTGCEEPTEG